MSPGCKTTWVPSRLKPGTACSPGKMPHPPSCSMPICRPCRPANRPHPRPAGRCKSSACGAAPRKAMSWPLPARFTSRPTHAANTCLTTPGPTPTSATASTITPKPWSPHPSPRCLAAACWPSPTTPAKPCWPPCWTSAKPTTSPRCTSCLAARKTCRPVSKPACCNVTKCSSTGKTKAGATSMIF